MKKKGEKKKNESKREAQEGRQNEKNALEEKKPLTRFIGKGRGHPLLEITNHIGLGVFVFICPFKIPKENSLKKHQGN